jgi:phospholipid/cholesterol/gamma-HCH transport system substrate-binding protein
VESYTRTEIAVGVFVLAGLAALAYLSVSLGGMRLLPGHEMKVDARFATVGGLKEGAAVRMAGVGIGKVKAIRLEDYAAEVTLALDTGLALPEDTIASIRTEGLLGEAFVSLSPGASEKDLQDGGRIARTEPPLDLVELLSKYAFGSVEGEGDDGARPPPQPPPGGGTP